MLAVGTYHGVRFVDPATGKVRWDEKNSEKQISSATISPDGRFVASVRVTEEHWKLWDAASGVLCMTGESHDGTGACVCKMTRNGSRVSLEEGCPVQAHTSGLLAVRTPPPTTRGCAGLWAVAFSPCGQRLATGGVEDSAVILWDVGTGKAEHVMRGHSDWVRAVSFSVDGARLASGSGDGSIRVWNATTGAFLRTIRPFHDGPAIRVHFSPTESKILASGNASTNRSQVWDVDSGEMLRSFAGRGVTVFSPDGRTIATLSISYLNVNLVNAESGAVLLTLIGHTKPIFSASYSPDDGSKLASGSYDGTCKVWDSSTGALLRTIEVGSTIFSVCWGRDWVVDTQRAMACAMGHHPRLGAGSQMQVLDVELVRMILDYALRCQ